MKNNCNFRSQTIQVIITAFGFAATFGMLEPDWRQEPDWLHDMFGEFIFAQTSLVLGVYWADHFAAAGTQFLWWYFPVGICAGLFCLVSIKIGVALCFLVTFFHFFDGFPETRLLELHFFTASLITLLTVFVYSCGCAVSFFTRRYFVRRYLCSGLLTDVL